MEQVRQFYLRNSDGTFNLNPIITPTVTIDYNKYYPFQDLDQEHTFQFDSSNGLIGSFEVDHDDVLLDGHGEDAVNKVAKASREWDFYGPAFRRCLIFLGSG